VSRSRYVVIGATGQLGFDLVRTFDLPGELTPLAHADLDILDAARTGAVLSRDLLLSRVWDYDYAGGSHTVDVHIRWLREKIESAPSAPQRIVTVRGIGYRFEG